MIFAYFKGRGYEVFAFPDPKTCPLSSLESCHCHFRQACADIIITDLNMPFMRGLDFLESQLEKGCRCRHMALMSGDLTEADSERAAARGIKLFNKPFMIDVVDEWIRSVEAAIPKGSALSDWHRAQEH